MIRRVERGSGLAQILVWVMAGLVIHSPIRRESSPKSSIDSSSSNSIQFNSQLPRNLAAPQKVRSLDSPANAG